MGITSHVAGHFNEPIGIRTVQRTDYKEKVGLRGYLFHGNLTVLCRVANVLSGWLMDIWEFFLQRADDHAGFIEAKSSLRYIRYFVRIGDLKTFHLFRTSHDLGYIGCFAQGTF